MPEVQIDKNLEMHRQCEIRRPSPEERICKGDLDITKPAGYYFDIVWIKLDLAHKGKQLIDEDGNVWTIAETYGAKLIASRLSLKKMES